MTYSGVSAASGSNFVKINAVTLGASVGSFQFDSVPQTYQMLMIAISGTTANTGEMMRMRFNSNSSSYDYLISQVPTTQGGTTTTTGASAQNHLGVGMLGLPAARQGLIKIWIPNYTDAVTFWKSFTSEYSVQGSGSSAWQLGQAQGMWANTAAVTTVNFLLNTNFFGTGLKATLYGIG